MSKKPLPDAMKPLDAHQENIEQVHMNYAMGIIAYRLSCLPPADRNDTSELLAAYFKETDRQERAAIMDAIHRIIFGVKQPKSSLRVMEPPSDDVDSKAYAEWLGAKVRELRKAKGWNQERLGSESGIPQSHVSRIENGVYSATQLTREKLAKALGVTERDLDIYAD